MGGGTVSREGTGGSVPVPGARAVAGRPRRAGSVAGRSSPNGRWRRAFAPAGRGYHGCVTPRPGAEPHVGARRPVCMIVHAYYEEDARVRREAESLVASGRPVDVFALRRPGDGQDAVIEEVRLTRLPVRRHQGAGIGTYVAEYVEFFARAMVAATAAHRTRHYALMQVHTLPDFLVFAGLPVRLSGVPLVLDLHEAMPEFFRVRFPAAAGPVPHAVLRAQERAATTVADAVITVNDALGDRLLDLGVPAEKLTVILNAPTLALFDRARYPERAFRADGRLRLVYAGALTPMYELDTVLEAVAALAGVRPDLDPLLDIYGRGDATTSLEARAHTLGIDDRVRFNGRIPLEDVPGAIAAADLGLAPTRRDRFTDLSLSTKLFEYAAMGKPVVASRLPTVERYFPPETVATYTSGDAADLARVVSRLADDPREREARVTRTGVRVDELGWDREGARYVALDRPPRRPGLSRTGHGSPAILGGGARSRRRGDGDGRRRDAGTRTAAAGAESPTRADGRADTGMREATSAAVSRDSRIAIVGLGYVGLPLALAFVEAGCTVVGIDFLRPPGRGALVRPLADRRHLRRPPRRRPRGGLPCRGHGRGPGGPGLRRRDLRLRPHPDRRGEGPGPRAGPCCGRPRPREPPRRTAHRPPEHHVPGDDDRALRRGPRGRRPGPRARLRPGVRSRAREPGGPRVREPRRPPPRRCGGPRRDRTGGGAAPAHQQPRRRAVLSDAAELAKLLENVFRNVNIALVNQLALLCERMGLDVWEVVDAAATKPFGFMPFRPGPGVGGHCIPVDPYYLSWRARHFDFVDRFVEVAGDINFAMPRHVVDLVAEALNDRGTRGEGRPDRRPRRRVQARRPRPAQQPRGADLSGIAARGGTVAYHDPHVPEFRDADGREHSFRPARRPAGHLGRDRRRHPAPRDRLGRRVRGGGPRRGHDEQLPRSDAAPRQVLRLGAGWNAG